MKLYEISDDLKARIAKEMKQAPSKQMFHARLQREIYPEIVGTTILHKNNNIEVYHYEAKSNI